MVPESDPRNVATLESLRTTCELTHQSITIRRGDHDFAALADLIDEGASAPDGPRVILLTSRRAYLIDHDGRAVSYEWEDITRAGMRIAAIGATGALDPLDPNNPDPSAWDASDPNYYE